MNIWGYRSVAFWILALALGATPGHAGIIAQNPWNSTTQPGWWFTGGFIDDTINTPNPPGVLRFTYPAGFVGGRSAGNAGYANLNHSEIYVGTWVKWSANWTWGTGNKLIYVKGRNMVTNTINNICFLNLFGPTRKIEIGWNPGTVAKVSANLYNPTIQANMWYWFEFHIKLNTPNVANGVLEVWINNVKSHNYTDRVYRRAGWGDTNSTNFTIEDVSNYASWSSQTDVKPATEHLYYDLTTISTTRIGMPGSPPDGEAPPAPASLTVR